MNEKRSLWGWIKYALGFYKNPPYVEERLKEADLRGAQFLSFVVGCVEIWMLIRYTIRNGSKCDTVGEFLQYTYGFWILLFSCAGLFAYTVLYFQGRLKRLKNYSTAFIFAFFAISLYFGATTAMSDFARGRMITCFLTIIMYVTIIMVRRPFISVLLTLGVSSGFLYLLNHFTFDRTGAQVVMNSGDTVNYVTFMISLGILEISVYFQRYKEACKSYSLEKAVITDDLTQIPNMHKFEADAKKYMEESVRDGKYPMYLVFDLEHFQTFNDHMNHATGDKLLMETGRIVASEFAGEPAARESGDLFVALTNAEDYQQRAENVRRRVKAAYPTETYLDVKTGAYRTKEFTREPRHAIDRAHYALKKIHNNENQAFVEYDEKMGKDYRLRQYVLNNLEKAVNEGYIQVFYQPVMWSQDGTLAGCEALARWIDPDMGFMSPGVFIPTLEEGRQIHKLDLCIYETVCKRIRACIDQGLPVLPTSLNFSRLDFELMDAVGELEKLVEKYRVPREYLHVEITESAVTKDVDGLKKAMKRLHDSGYAVWLDDFGSGYSSMNVLKDLDFDLLKIDMEFLKNFHDNPNSRKIISTVIDLAEKLDMLTLCEGVETEEAVTFLREAGCGRMQGYYYGKPMPYDDLLAKIEKGDYILPAGGKDSE